MFKTILVPVDLAEPDMAKGALDTATMLAKASGGTIRLIYVRTLVPASVMDFMPAEYDAREQAESEEQIAALAGSTGLEAGRVTHAVKLGSVYHEVLAEADAVKADLIVLSSHRPTMATYLIGSNAATITRHATCSVLVLRGGGTAV